MAEFVLRPWRTSDLPQMRQLITDTYGDPPEVTDAFYRHFLTPDSCLVAEAEGTIVSACYALPGPEIRWPMGNGYSTEYLYAMSTREAYRGHQLGVTLSRRIIDEILDRSDCAYGVPASPGLFPVYQRICGTTPFTDVMENTQDRETLLQYPTAEATPISPTRYAALREEMLANQAHGIYPAAYFALMEEFGVRFLALPGALAAAETVDGVCHVWELLAPAGNVPTVAAAVAALCPAELYILRTPLFWPGEGKRRTFTSGRMREGLPTPPADCWLPFSLE